MNWWLCSLPVPAVIVGRFTSDRSVLISDLVGECVERRHGARAVLRQGEREEGALVAGGGREAAKLRPAARHGRQLDRPAAESRYA